MTMALIHTIMENRLKEKLFRLVFSKRKYIKKYGTGSPDVMAIDEKVKRVNHQLNCIKSLQAD